MTSQPGNERHNQLIAKYYIPDMGDNSIVGSQLSAILERLDVSSSLSLEDKKYIRDKGLFDLSEFVNKLEENGKPDFRILRTKFEQKQRKALRRELWEKYDLGYVESAHMRKMMEILHRIENNERILDEDAVWLATHDYFSSPLKRRFHENEAKFHKQSFRHNKNPWEVVNASSHYRKAELPSQAIAFLEEVEIEHQSDKHLRSALYTTKGGANRDLKKLDEALRLAEKGHQSDPRSFHPCTLIGAVNFELGNYPEGAKWFEKAIERGAKQESVDQELRTIFARAGKAQQEEMKRHLLKIDPDRYCWVNKIKVRTK